jgi:hypothetical protein
MLLSLSKTRGVIQRWFPYQLPSIRTRDRGDPTTAIHDLNRSNTGEREKSRSYFNQAPANVTKPITDMQEQIRLRAYELYERRGIPGYELEDWLQAESELAEQMKTEGAG